MPKGLSTTIGTTYRPTPVPEQVGRTSFVDASIVGASLGERYQFKVFDRTFVLAVTTQLLHMLPRTTYKDPARTLDAYPDDARTLRGGDAIPEARGLQTNSPGFPGYRAEGWLLSTSIALAYLL